MLMIIYVKLAEIDGGCSVQSRAQLRTAMQMNHVIWSREALSMPILFATVGTKVGPNIALLLARCACAWWLMQLEGRLDFDFIRYIKIDATPFKDTRILHL